MKNKGFTLVGVIIYTSLFSLLMIGFISFSIATTSLYAKSRSMEEVLYSARQINQVLNYYIKNSNGGETIPSLAQASASLKMNLVDGSDARIYLDNGQIMLRIDLDESLQVTTNEVRISDLSFKNYSSSGDFDSIKITCLISFASADSLEYSYQYNFSTSINTKN